MCSATHIHVIVILVTTLFYRDIAKNKQGDYEILWGKITINVRAIVVIRLMAVIIKPLIRIIEFSQNQINLLSFHPLTTQSD